MTEKKELYEIGCQMEKDGLSKPFIAAAIMTAREFEGVYDLMQLWQEYTEPEIRADIVADIQDMIDDCDINLGHTSPPSRPKLFCNNEVEIIKSTHSTLPI
jgi:hypothetical protein